MRKMKSELPLPVLDTSCCNISVLFQTFFGHNDDCNDLTIHCYKRLAVCNYYKRGVEGMDMGLKPHWPARGSALGSPDTSSRQSPGLTRDKINKEKIG